MTQSMKRISWSAVVLSVALLWGACGDDDSSNDAGGAGGDTAGTGGGTAGTGGDTAGTGGGTAGTGGGTAGSGGGQDAAEPDAGGATTDAGASDAGADSGGGAECVGEVCTCDMDESCDFTPAANGKVECLGGHCTADCPEGSCELDADFQANVEYECSGGGCAVDCDNSSICGLDCSGGGCEVVCDADSTCTVSCPETGEPCTLTCEAGGRGTCEGDCNTEGCDDTCVPDETIQVEIDTEDFSTTIDNPFLPLPVGAEWIYEAPDELITVTVTDETKTVMGVDVLVVHDQVTDPETDELIEDTFDWYAQDSEGNVWYFGEDTAEYLNGEIASTAGAWEAGVDGAQPGIIMKASPEVGDVYYQEYYACEAEDQGEVVALDVSVEGQPTGDYSGCISIRDFTALEPSADEIKTYCQDVGLVLVTEVVTGDEPVEVLTSVTMP